MGRIADFKSMIEERRLGFSADEVMSGRHRFEPGFGPDGDQFFEFRVTWGPKNLARWVNPFAGRFMVQELSGFVTAEGLCEAAPCQGTLELKYFSDHLIRYSFSFEADGTACRYVGEKVNIKLWNLPVSHTTCFGRLTEIDTGRLVSTSVTHFRMRTLPGFLLSFRLA